MKKRIFTFLTLLVAFFGLIGLTTNNYKVINAAGNQSTVDSDLAAINIPETALISFPVTYKSVYGNDIDWSVEKDQTIITYDEEAHWMVVNRPTEGVDQEIDITVTVTGADNATATKTVTVTVPVGVTETKEYQINYELQGGTNHQDNPSSYHLGEATIKLEAPTKEGYTFEGWYAGEQKVEKILVGSMQDYTLTAKWAPKQYTITFDTDGGTAIDPITQDYGTAVTAPADPTKEGYEFSGWDIEIPSTMPAGDVNITAQWTVNQYTVTFIVDNETVKTGKYDFDSLIDFPDEPTKEGATFTGWFLEEEKYEEGKKVPSKDITLVAGWDNKAQFTITFVTSEDATVIPPITVYEGVAVENPGTPTKEGYDFAGWKNEQSEVVEFPYTPTKDITLTAQWNIKQYKVIFKDWNGTTLKEEQTVNHGSAAVAPADPTREGYKFTGWDTDFTSVKSNLTITAQYEILTYKVIFKDWDETVLKEEQTVNHGSAAIAPDDPTREGYKFIGWDTTFTSVTSDLTITAQYEILTYKVIFKDWDGTVLKEEQTVNHGSAAIAPDDPTREEFTFAGWDTNFTSVTSDLTITALYTPNNMAEYIASEMEKVIAEELTEANLETELKEAIALVKGYDGGSVFFTSENTAISVDAEGNVTLIAPTNLTTVTLKATITHVGDTTTATYRTFDVQLTGVTYGNMTNNNVTVENVPTNAELTVTEVENGNINVTVEGKEIAVAYDITLVSGNNNLNGEFTVRIPVPQEHADAEKFYVYHIVGDEETLVAEVTPVDGYIEFTTTHFSVYALYVNIVKFNITYNLNGGQWTTKSIESYEEFREAILSDFEAYFSEIAGEDVTISRVSENTDANKDNWHKNDFMGISFDYREDVEAFFTTHEVYAVKWGWVLDKLKEDGIEADSGWESYRSTTLRGWTHGFIYQTQYTKWPVGHDYSAITFEEIADKGYIELAMPGEAMYNSTIGLELAKAQKEGYTFLGWKLNEEVINKIEIGTTGNLELIAEWEINTYTLTTIIDGEETKATIEYGAPITIADPTKEGYEFTGWNPTLPTTMPAEDVTVEAQFTPKNYTLTTIVDGQEEKLIFAYGATISVADPTKEGYEFTGWNPTLPTTMPAEDVTVEAQFEEVQQEQPLFENGTTIIIAAIRTKGNYFLMTSDLGTADTKRYQAIDSGKTDVANLVAEEENQIWTIEYEDGKYYLKSSEGLYASHSSGNSGILSEDKLALTVVYNEETSTYTFSYAASDAERYIALNGSTGTDFFAFYKSGQKQDLVIKEVDGVTEKTDAEKVSLDRDALSLPETTTENLTLPLKGENGSTITWSSNHDAITSEGIVTRESENVSVTLTATITLGMASATKEFTVIVEAETSTAPTTSYFEKITSAPTDWSGTYLIVYEAGSVAFNGSLTSLDAASNGTSVIIDNNKIQATSAMKNIAFKIEKSESNYVIKSASGYYIGNTADSNKLNSSTSTKYANTITLEGDGTVKIVGSGNSVLRYNSASDNLRFRYYKSSSYSAQKAIALYKLSE